MGGRDAAYRKFRLHSGDSEREIEQWTVPTAPGVKFHRESIDPETEDDPRTCDLATLLRRIEEGDRRSDGGPPVASIPVWFGLDGAKVIAVT